MRNFDLYESRNFKGGQYTSSFKAETIDQFNQGLINGWLSSALHRTTGEIFVFTEIEFDNETYDFQLGYYCLEDDGQINALFNIPDENSFEYDICESLGVIIDRSDEEKTFINLVNALFK